MDSIEWKTSQIKSYFYLVIYIYGASLSRTPASPYFDSLTIVVKLLWAHIFFVKETSDFYKPNLSSQPFDLTWLLFVWIKNHSFSYGEI